MFDQSALPNLKCSGLAKRDTNCFYQTKRIKIRLLYIIESYYEKTNLIFIKISLMFSNLVKLKLTRKWLNKTKLKLKKNMIDSEENFTLYVF